jgi:hypothetical protein
MVKDGDDAGTKPVRRRRTGDVEVALSPGVTMVAQRRAVRRDGWTKARRETFLAALMQTCNIAHATRTAGMRPNAAYELRRRDPAFAGLLAEALRTGYERLEGALLGHALQEVDAIDLAALPEPPASGTIAGMPGVAPAKEVTRAGIELALSLLKQHHATVRGSGKRRPPAALPTAEETDRQLLARLELLARKRRAQERSVKP